MEALSQGDRGAWANGAEVSCLLGISSKARLHHILLIGVKGGTDPGGALGKALSKLAKLLKRCRMSSNHIQETARPVLATSQITILRPGKVWYSPKTAGLLVKGHTTLAAAFLVVFVCQ